MRFCEKLGSDIKKGDIALLYIGWGAKRDFTRKYMKDFPSLDESAAEWLVKKGVKGVGMRAKVFRNWCKLVFILFLGFGGSFEAYICS